MSHTLGVSHLGVWQMAPMAYLLRFINGFSYQSVVVWSSILDPAMGAMSRQEGEKRCISESNLLDVNGFNVKSELSRSSGGNRAAGQATHIQGWILHLYCTGLCETFNTKIVNEKENNVFKIF